MEQQRLAIKAHNGATTTVKTGDAQIQVSSGALMHQVNGDITVKGDGQGDILFIQGESGFKIDSNGNVKLFGPKITLNSQSGVTFNGDVQYEAGAANDPEDAYPLDLPEIEALDWLVHEEPEPRREPGSKPDSEPGAEPDRESQTEPTDYRLPIRIVDGGLQPLSGIEVKCAHLHDPFPMTATTNGDGLAVFTLPRKVKQGLISFEQNGQTQVRPFHAGTLAPSDVEAGWQQRLVNLSATARLPGKKETRAAEQVVQALSEELNTPESTLTDTLGQQE